MALPSRRTESPMNPAGQNICLNMIVKNEASVIRRCIDSVRPIVDHWVIVDTGSTDGTQDIIRGHLHDLPGELHERPWRDFAHNRSEALELARGKSDYTLIIDRSGSMALKDQAGGRSRWAVARESALALAAKCDELDPDGSVAAVFLPRRDRAAHMQTAFKGTRAAYHPVPRGSTRGLATAWATSPGPWTRRSSPNC